jgi:patatin-related protein
MRVKELRFALVCYGGVSLAVYMHGITKEVWKLLQASRAVADGSGDLGLSDSARVYRQLLADLGDTVRLRVLTDIVAGASAGGINGIFLAQAIATGESLEPLRELWLGRADIDTLLDPDARPSSDWSKMWASPLAWMAMRGRAGSVDKLVGEDARAEVKAKLSHFVRSRWFEPPFGGEIFTGLLLDGFGAMAAAPRGKRLIPPNQPLDLFVTVTDFQGHPERLTLNSPPEVVETEHRLVIGFHGAPGATALAHPAELVFAGRATASFPGAFPPFGVAELDAVLKARGMDWPGREAFLARIFPRQTAAGLPPEATLLIDGSVLANAPFRPAIAALRQRPAHRQIDRRFVYIDPKPGRRSINLARGEGGPGFFTTILRAMSDIPREQPIRDNLEAIETMSRRIRRLRHIVTAMRDEVDAAIDRELGGAFFLDRPTPERLATWRARANTAAAAQAGYTYAAYAQLKLAQVIEEMAVTLGDLVAGAVGGEAIRRALWDWAEGQDFFAGAIGGKGGSDQIISFFRRLDLGFRIRRLRFLARRIEQIGGDGGDEPGIDAVRREVYDLLGPLLGRRSRDFFGGEVEAAARDVVNDPARAVAALDAAYGLKLLDDDTDARLTEAFAGLGKGTRRNLLLAYLGFSFYDIATLPLLQGEGLDEFDPIKVDRIAPDDATSIRAGGIDATLKGVEFNSFGAFFSRAYRENDYLWGRLHGAERLIDIVLSTLPDGDIKPGMRAAAKRAAFLAILDAEEPHLTAVPDLVASLRREIGA